MVDTQEHRKHILCIFKEKHPNIIIRKSSTRQRVVAGENFVCNAQSNAMRFAAAAASQNHFAIWIFSINVREILCLCTHAALWKCVVFAHFEYIFQRAYTLKVSADKFICKIYDESFVYIFKFRIYTCVRMTKLFIRNIKLLKFHLMYAQLANGEKWYSKFFYLIKSMIK